MQEVPSCAQTPLSLQIPIPAIQKLPKDLFSNAPAGVPIIDTSNYYPGMRDPQIPDIDAGMPESVWVSRQLGRPVIKAFNNILAHSLAELGKPEGAARRLAVAVAGDDAAAKKDCYGIRQPDRVRPAGLWLA
jgi:8-hydroxy-5-deazaflavin:NADPH oxidoreductase